MKESHHVASKDRRQRARRIWRQVRFVERCKSRGSRIGVVVEQRHFQVGSDGGGLEIGRQVCFHMAHPSAYRKANEYDGPAVRPRSMKHIQKLRFSLAR